MTLRDEVEKWITAKLVGVSDGRLQAESIHAGTLLRQDVGLTSLLAVNVIVDVEERFGIVVTDEELTRLGTAGDVVALILAKLSPRSAGME